VAYGINRRECHRSTVHTVIGRRSEPCSHQFLGIWYSRSPKREKQIRGSTLTAPIRRDSKGRICTRHGQSRSCRRPIAIWYPDVAIDLATKRVASSGCLWRQGVPLASRHQEEQHAEKWNTLLQCEHDLTFNPGRSARLVANAWSGPPPLNITADNGT
jgi:hypothetical protein